ncbi:MAG: amino acid ABC transporter ATP-binding protein [Bacillota bacterium]|nr:amino acid ABC transporter ATP-binding protein [Bacillota bacterium]
MNKTMIQVAGLCKHFGDVEVLRNVSFTVSKGETIAVIGPSGSGKSTMLRCLINLEKSDNGTIDIEGKTLCKDGIYQSKKACRSICAKMGMVFQNFNLFPHISVINNLIYAPHFVKRQDKKELIVKAHEILAKVGLSDKENAMPNELSGGQKQRVAIARALMMNPDMLLFDEPTSSLDPQLTGEVLAVMKELAMEKMTMIIVTHEMAFAREVADRILFMGENSILADDVPEKIFQNPNEKIAGFINSII